MISCAWTSHADRQFRKLPVGLQRQILKKLDFFLAAPDPVHFAEPLMGHRGHVFRFRVVGDYRVIFEVEGNRCLILEVGHRREVYR